MRLSRDKLAEACMPMPSLTCAIRAVRGGERHGVLCETTRRSALSRAGTADSLSAVAMES